MIVMFILMLLPVLAIPLFFFLPPAASVPLYLLGLALSGWMFWLMRNNKRRPVATGHESLVGRDSEIISISENGNRSYMLRIEGELWSALSDDLLKPGDRVTITASRGNTLYVKRINGKAGNRSSA